MTECTPGIAIIGAGTLGRQIARLLAVRDEDITLFDTDPAIARKAAETATRLARSDHPGSAIGRIAATGDLAGAVSGRWLVIECIPERVDLKAELFGELDRLTPVHTILTSNSSSIPASRLISGVRHPERVANAHFYNGSIAVEVMGCGRTDPAVIRRLMEAFRACGLRPFEVRKESVGFIYNRIWAAVKREALEIVAQGIATADEVDAIFGHVEQGQAGPFRRMDGVGLDVVLDIERNYAAEYPGLPAGPRALLESYVAGNRLGQKTGRGFYDDYPG